MNCKKVFAAILTVILTISLFNSSVFAADTPVSSSITAVAGSPGGGIPGLSSSGVTYSSELADFNSIQHREAVSIMVKLGLIKGIRQDDGSYAYMPQQTIDRAAMAKLLFLATTLINHENIAEKKSASFADIDGNWAEKYIEYCVDKGIIAGKTASMFDPSGSVTVIEAAKMLLAAMGKSGLSGNGWAEATVSAAKENGLFTGITADIKSAITRDDAAQLIYNALIVSDGTSLLPGLVVIKNTTKASEYTIKANTIYAAPEGKVLTMTVDGIQTRIAEGNYKGNIVLSVTDPFRVSHMGNNYDLRMGAFINNGTYMAASSVESSILAGTITDANAYGIKIDSEDDNFNPIVIAGNSEYSITGADITMNGHGLNDFAGHAAGIMATDNSKVTINNSTIHTTGAIRTGIWAGGNSTVLVKNSTIIGKDGTDLNFKAGMFKEIPWVLGLKGNLRVTNVLGSAKVTYFNCDVQSENWGVLSTDSTSDGASLTAIASKISITGDSGYGSYADIVVQNHYYGCTFNVPDYALIVASGTCGATFGKASLSNVGKTLYDELSDDQKDADTVVNSNRFGIMWHKNQGGTVEIQPGTVFNTGKTVFLVKSDAINPACPNLIVDGARLNSESGSIFTLMESDDPGMNPNGGGPGSDTMWAEGYTVPKVVPVKDDNDTTDPKAKNTVNVTFKNMKVNGDIYNSRWTAGQNLNVVFENADVAGVISAGTQSHVNVKPGEVITKENYKEISNIKVVPSEAISNGVIVSLDSDSTWNVTGTSYVTRLTVAEGAKITGKNLKMYVNGVETEIKPGTYTGNIKLAVE